jgi:hypothetical protein
VLAAADITGPFRARFDGFCKVCDLPTSVGQKIVRLSWPENPDWHDLYVHDGCVGTRRGSEPQRRSERLLRELQDRPENDDPFAGLI